MSFAESAARIEWSDCWLAASPLPRDLAGEVRRATGGIVPTWASRLAPVPWVVRALASVIQPRVAFMPVRLWGLIGLIVSQDNSCRYCYGATRTLLRIAGYQDDLIERLERDVHLADLTPPERAALDFARRVSHANPRPTPRDRQALAAAGFAPPAVAEIAYAAAMGGFPNRLATFFALPSERMHAFVDSPLFRVVRPALARLMRPVQASPEPNPAVSDAPCGAVVAALGESPTARTVRDVLDAAFASTILPTRTKLLIFAVVGRALGCVHSETEARARLVGEGLTTGDVDAILANLGSPALDRRDGMLILFARDAVRYQTGAIQRRTRELAAELPIDELIEGAAVAALANSIGRLSILLETC